MQDRGVGIWDQCADCYDLVLILEGSAMLTIGDKVYHLHPTRFALVPPDTACQYSIKRPHTALFHLQFQTRLIHESKVARAYEFPASDEMVENVTALKERRGSILSSDSYDEKDHVAVSLLSYELAVLALRHIPKENLRRRHADYAFDRAAAYINDHLDENITNQKLAEIANIDLTSFARSFQAHTGMTPKAFVMNRRFRKACDLLTQTNKSIEDVAKESGFSDRYSFSHVFKRSAGMGPAEFRKTFTFEE
ncbi:MAG: helix-turn-helix domain-containing protein [Candidatus Sumerlaeia bacterium]